MYLHETCKGFKFSAQLNNYRKLRRCKKKGIAKPMVKVLIVSPLCSVIKDFPQDIHLSQLCERIYPLTGIAPSGMRLTFEGEGNKVLDIISDPLSISDTLPLVKYDTVDRILVEDTDINSVSNQLRQCKDDHDVATFTLLEEDYAQKSDTVLNWKIQNKLGRFDPQYKDRLNKDRKLQQEKVGKLELDQRCSIKTKEQAERRGYLRFVGKIPEINNYDIWCGVEFDEPVGKNNGSFNDQVYFGPVSENYGGFVKPLNVETGPQFTPLVLDFELSDISEDEV